MVAYLNLLLYNSQRNAEDTFPNNSEADGRKCRAKPPSINGKTPSRECYRQIIKIGETLEKR